MTEHEERAEAIRLLNSEGGSTLIPSALLSQIIVESQQRDALLDTLRDARGRLDANADYILRSTRNAKNDELYAKSITVWAREAQRAIEKATA